MFRFGISAAIVAVFATGCASVSTPVGKSASEQNAALATNLVEEFPTVTIANLAQRPAPGDSLKPGDAVSLRIFGVEELSGDFVVDNSGGINFPLIGRQEVTGLSAMGLQKLLVSKYGQSYLRNPSIVVDVESRMLGKFVVDGAVGKPGVFELFEIINLTQAIALAEGVSEDADRKQIYIIRDFDGTRRVKQVDLNDIRKTAASDPQIIPNDVVFVEDSRGRLLFKEFLKTIPLLNTAAILAVR